MDNFITRISDKASRVIKCWWLFLLGGLFCIACGIVVFCKPASSYLALSMLFGIMFLVTGAIELIVALTSRSFFMMRGYNIAGSILDILIGIFLCSSPDITMTLLPIFLGIWLMYHSFMILGFCGDLRAFNISGTGWGYVGGIALLLLSILITFRPFSFGFAAVVTLSGLALIIIGGIMVAGSLNLRNLHKSVQESFGPINFSD